MFSQLNDGKKKLFFFHGNPVQPSAFVTGAVECILLPKNNDR